MFPKSDIYRRFIEDNFKIVDKRGEVVDFRLNAPQLRYLEEGTAQDIILKSRQEGFSSLIDAIFTADFLLKNNSFSVVVADVEDNAVGLLDRIKIFIASFEEKHKVKIPLKYNSRFELYNEAINSRFVIGTAKNTEFGRSKTITNLHLSECAFYPNIPKIIAGAGQAVVDGGKKIFETTANGYNDFRDFYYRSRQGLTGYKTIFFPASEFYTPEFLQKKRDELGDMFEQEYPETEDAAFLTTGKMYFNRDAVKEYLTYASNYLQRGTNVLLETV
jgi:hypothetical protein